jgi:DNA-directed DNA polymerase III PolC
VLQTKSDHSLGYGCAAPEELVRAAAQLGLESLGLTDVETLSGQVRFHEACRHYGVHPVTGVELRPEFSTAKYRASKAGRMVLLARNERGYRNLCRVVTARRASGSPSPLAALAGDGEGLFVLSDDPAILDQLIESDLDRASLGVLLVRPRGVRGDEQPLFDRARRYQLPMVASVDAVMPSAREQGLYCLLRAMFLRRSFATVQRSARVQAELRDLGSWRRELFADCPGAFFEAERIAAQCALDLLALPRSFPAWPGDPHEHTEELRARCLAVVAPLPAYRQRLHEELATIEARALGSYFLVIAEILRELRSRDIAVIGRGSAVGSLVAHALGVSPVDPVAHELLFERFLHPSRTDLPDIDLDVPSERRDEVLAWVSHRFGADRVAAISTLVTFQQRAAFREGLRALGVTPLEIARFVDALPDDGLGRKLPLALLPARIRPQLPVLESLRDRPRHLSVHPGGLVIASDPIVARAPLQWAPKGVLVTQYDTEAVARLGLVKIDVLGNRCLSELEQTRLATRGSQLNEVPSDDPATLALIDSATTLGCFQLETPAMRSLLRQLPVHKMSDVCDALALIRPGAASGHAKLRYVRRRRGEEDPETHPLLKESLAATLGLFLYEEDIVRAISKLSQVTLADAEQMRTAILRGELGAPELAQRWSALGISAEDAHSIAVELVRFAAYTFSKAHALAYARLAYLSAYMKVHQPTHYACALLTHHAGVYPLRTLVSDLMRSGARFLPPNVNASSSGCHVDGAVRIGLSFIKRLTQRTREGLLRERSARGPFRDLWQLLERVPMTQRECQALVLSGACDELAPLSVDGYPFVHEAVLALLARNPSQAEMLNFQAPHARPLRPEDTEDFDTYRRLVRVRNELAVLDIHLSDHPMAILRREATRVGCTPSHELSEYANESVRFAGIISATRRIQTSSGKVMQFVTLEDEHGLVEGTIMPEVFERLGTLLRQPGAFLLSARVRIEHDDVTLSVVDATRFSSRPPREV